MKFKQYLKDKSRPKLVTEEIKKDVSELLETLSITKDKEEALATFYAIFEVLKPTANVLGVDLNIQEPDEE